MTPAPRTLLCPRDPRHQLTLPAGMKSYALIQMGPIDTGPLCPFCFVDFLAKNVPMLSEGTASGIILPGASDV